MSECDDGMPRDCVDKFMKIEGSLSRIESKVDGLTVKSKTFADRVWGVTKGVVLIVAGWFIAKS